jgi:ferredoxin-NADP reductase
MKGTIATYSPLPSLCCTMSALLSPLLLRPDGCALKSHVQRPLVRSAASLRAPVRRRLHVCASTAWHAARVQSSERAAEGLRSLVLAVPGDVARGFVTPGQYVQVRAAEADKPAYIAIASPVTPGAATLELLIKSSPGTDALCSLPAGGALQVSDVQGKGFPCASWGGLPETILIFATGSGLSPIRSLLETPAAQGGLAGVPGVRLFLGVRNAAHLPFAERLQRWEQAGVVVTRVFSEAKAGYVQDAWAAAAAGLKLNPAKTGAVVVGQKAMSEAVVALLTGAGVERSRVVSNF